MTAEVGQPAPDFTLYDTDRKPRSRSEFQGQSLVLAFFPGAFTGVCTTEACALRDQLADFNGLNAQVVGISVDAPFALKKWADDNGVNYPLLSDFNREAVNACEVALPNLAGMENYVAANRAVLVVDKEGIIRYRWVAPTPATEPDYADVRAAVAALA